MGKLIAVTIVIAAGLRFWYRKTPRLARRIVPWCLGFAAALLLLAYPWNHANPAILGVRLGLALATLAVVLFDIRRTIR